MTEEAQQSQEVPENTVEVPENPETIVENAENVIDNSVKKAGATCELKGQGPSQEEGCGRRRGCV